MKYFDVIHLILQDMAQAIPTQDLVAKDLHGFEWRFKHIFRGRVKPSAAACFLVLLYYLLYYIVVNLGSKFQVNLVGICLQLDGAHL